ncbi:MAG: flagellar filament capping protein FliD [Lachnospiraceae bacterium]|nr:flagellar filament capping protein FliD [Lachnospiraceae bacterium]
MPIRITGLASGLDTEALVSELVSAYRTKTEKYTKAQTKLSWTQDAWKSLNSKIYSMYTSISSLRYSSAYTLKEATISDSTKASVTASSSAVVGVQSLSVDSVAKSGYLTGAELADGTTSSSTLSSLGFTSDSGTISLSVGGETTDIEVTGDMTISDFVSKLQDAGVNASYDSTNQRIYVSAKSTGTENDFSLTGNDSGGLEALSTLGLLSSSDTDTAYYESLAAIYEEAGGTEEALASYLTDIITNLESASATVTNNTAEISYANAYSGAQKYIENLTSDEYAELKELMSADSDTIYDADGNETSLAKHINTTDSDGNHTYYYTYEDDDGNTVTLSEEEYEEAGYYTAEERIEELGIKAGLTETTTTTDDDGNETEETTFSSTLYATFKTYVNTIDAYEEDEDNADEVSEVQAAYAAGTLDELTESLQTEIDEANEYIDEYSTFSGYTSSDIDTLTDKILTAVDIVENGLGYTTSAIKIDGTDAKITLNGATYESSSNEFSINGLDITALSETDDGEELTITTSNNTQGMYDKIKDFLTTYNEVINEMTKLYNADSASGYEPLTSDEKDAMTDTQIEEWEQKIKDSLLRRDTTLGTLINTMTTAMAKSYTGSDGNTYALSSFGINTLGYLYAEDDEENAFHIDGDSDDSYTSSNTDKLLSMLKSDPEAVEEFMKNLTSGLYDAIGSKMKSTSLSSAYTVYNDKEMSKEYSDYSDIIDKWEEKLEALEESYYSKFAAMESALAELQAQQSQLAGLLG